MNATAITAVLCALWLSPCAATTLQYSGRFDQAADTALVSSDLGPAALTDDTEIANNVAWYAFTTPAAGVVTITSSGFALGGADPYFTLFKGADRTATFVASNATQAFAGGGDFAYSAALAAGAYQLTIGAFANMSFAENTGGGTLADGFIGLGVASALGNQHYSVSVTTPVPEPSIWALLAMGSIGLGLSGGARRARVPLSLAFSLASSLACAQPSSELAQRLIAIGPVINPAATAALYGPRIAEKEPYEHLSVERDLAYGADERNLLDVIAPLPDDGKLRPVLVFVHGGGYVGGSRRTGPGSPFYDNVMLWAARHGMVGVNMTYRLAPKNAWPSGPQDIGQAIQWIHEHIAHRGGDPARVFLFGHSAGASHVASYVAWPEFQRVAGSGLAGAMLLSGVYSITPELMAQSPTYASYFGTDASTYRQESSLDGLLATRVPLWVGSAELDPPQFKAQAELLTEGLRRQRGTFQATVFAGHSHMSEAYSIHSDDRAVEDALMAFVNAR